MSALTNSFTSFAAVGNREDLVDTVYNISPVDTPFLGAIEKTVANAVLHEWQTDALADATVNAHVEGDDSVSSNYSFQSVTPTVRLSNRCQISRKDVVVSGTQNKVKRAGRNDDEVVYQMLKRSRELKRDIEFTLCNNQAAIAGTLSVARQLRPLSGWYNSNVFRGVGGANGTASTAAVDGTERPLTESMLKTALQAAWQSGGTPDLIMSGAFNKTVISGFSGGNNRMQDTSDGKLSTAIDIYESDFGTHTIAANRFSRDRDLHIITTEMWAIAYLRPMQTLDLAKTGDNEKAQILAEYTLEARNEKASAIIADLVTTTAGA